MHNPSKQKTPMPVQEPKVRSRNFDEVALGYTEEQAVSEAQRCLNCRNKPCVGGCPVSINIPAFIHEVAERNFEGAYEILSRSTALPAVCGRVCPQESQCESRCVCGIKGEPVGIGRLERFVADWHSANATEKPVRPAPNGHKVAVIGSGMTGLETSELLVSQGNHVTIVEMAPRIAPGAYFQHVDDAMPKLQAAQTVFMVGQKLLAVHPDSIELENVDTGSKTMVPCDLVVLSLGVRPENGLYESIKSSFSRVYNIGDSNKIGRIHNATEAAYQLAMSL